MADRVTILSVAGSHSFFGSIDNRGLRVLDVLNDISSDYLQLYDVAVLRGIRGELIEQLPEATIPKSALDLVLLESNKHEAPVRRRHAFVPKEMRGVDLAWGL